MLILVPKIHIATFHHNQNIKSNFLLQISLDRSEILRFDISASGAALCLQIRIFLFYKLETVHASVFSLQELKFDQAIRKDFRLTLFVVPTVANYQLIQHCVAYKWEKGSKLASATQINKTKQMRICCSYYYLSILNLPWENFNHVCTQPSSQL